MSDQEQPQFAAPRDASWYRRPNTTSVKKMHVSNGYGAALCNATMPLDESLSLELSEVPHSRRCMQARCREAWPKDTKE